MTDETNKTPISATAQSSSAAISASEVGKECLDIIEAFRRSERNPLDKTKSIHEPIFTLTTVAPELTGPKCNDATSGCLSNAGAMIYTESRKISEGPGT